MRKKAGRATYGYIAPFIWGDLSLNYFLGTVRGAEKHDANLICVLGQVPNDTENDNASANIAYDLINKRLRDGLIIWASHYGQYLSKTELEEFYQKFTGIPIVSISDFIQNSPAVLMENRNGLAKLVDHFVKVHGYTKIAFIPGEKYHRSSRERYKGYIDGMQRNNIEVDERLIAKPGLIDEDQGKRAVRYFLDVLGLKVAEDIEVIIGVSDAVILGAARELNQRGIKIPDQVALGGFNNKNESRMFEPPITTIDPQLFNYGQEAMELLVKIGQGKKVPIENYVPSKLVRRVSCGCDLMAYSVVDHTGKLSKEVVEAIIDSLKDVSYQSIHWLGEDWLSKLVNEFITSVDNPESDSFMSYLSHILKQLEGYEEQSIGHLNIIITEMRKKLLPYFTEKEQILRAADLWDQARMKIYFAIQFLTATSETRVDRLLFSLHHTNQTLMTSYANSELHIVIEKLLSRLDIRSCFISLFTDDTRKNARLFFAYQDKHMLEFNRDTVFDAKDIVPDRYLPKNRRFTYVLIPLYFRDLILGYAIFEPGPIDKAIYQILCSEISTALHRIEMFEELKRSEYERSKLLKSLSEKNVELEQRIEERTADLQRANNRLQQAIDDANAANNAKSRFLANISHEIRTPLNCIIGFAEILSTAQDHKQIKAYVQLIIQECEKLITLINQILDIAKIEEGKVALATEPFDILHLLEEIKSVYATMAENKNLDFSIAIDQSIPQYVIGDEMRLRQVLVNLVGNAIKFTKKGKIEIDVKKTNETDAEIALQFRISDTGIGIAQDRQQAIFDVFVQAEDSITRNFGGSGLGITISKQLVELMNGEIWLESELGKGSTFWFTTILQKADTRQLQEQKQQSADEELDEKILAGINILLVEDYAVNRQLVKAHLEKAGITVYEAENGIEAIEMTKKRDFDLILMDVQMPKMDGLEATRIIRSTERGMNTIIIGLTAHAYEDDVIKYRKAGMDDVITKPFRRVPFLRKLISWLSNKIDIQDSLDQAKTSSASPSNQDNDLIDYGRLLDEFCGDRKLLQKLLTEFINNSEQQLRLLQDAVNELNYEQITNLAHKIRGGALNLAADKLASLAADLEICAQRRVKSVLIEKYEQLVSVFEQIKNDFIS